MSRRSGERILDVELNEPLTGYDYAIEWLLGAALVFSPLAYGATNAWAEQVLYGLIALMAILAGIKLSRVRGSRVVLTWAYLPIVLYLLVVALSIIPLPAALVKAISPGTVEVKTQLLSDVPSIGQLLSHLTISFNVWSTLMGLRMVFAMSVVFVVIANICQTKGQITRVLMMVAGAGLIVTLLTLAQDFTQGSEKIQRIYWNLPLISVDAVHRNSGPFAGHAQLGQYLNLTIGAMLALAVVQIGQAFHGEDPSVRDMMDRINSAPIRLAILLGLAMTAALAAIAWSLARGALVGTAVGGIAVMLMLIYKRGWRKSETVILLNIVLLLAILAGAGYFVFEKAFVERRGNVEEGGATRLAIVKSMGPMIHQWPVMGTGLESFEWVYPMYQPIASAGLFFTHAENDYAQTISDTGIVGGALTLAFVLILIVNWKKAFAAPQPIQLATVGIAYSLIAVMVHSTADFSQRTPAVAMVTSALLGLTISLSRLAARSNLREPAKPTFGWMPLPRMIVTGVVGGLMVWSVWSLNRVARAESLSWHSDPTVFFIDAKPTDPDFKDKLRRYYYDPIADNTKAAELDPLNVENIYDLNHFRFRELSGMRDPETTAVIYPPEATQVGQKIVDELSAARVLCPTYGRPRTLLGKIQWDLLDSKSMAEKNLELARKLRPTDSEPVYYLCQIAAEQGRWDDALQLAKETLRRNSSYGGLLKDLFVYRHNRVDLAYEVLKDNEDALGSLVDAIRSNPDLKPLAATAQGRLLELNTKSAEAAPLDSGVWLRLARRQRDAGMNADAVDSYNKAITQDYGNTELRMQFANFLVTIGRPEEAGKQAEICLRLNPQLDEAKNMLKSLNTLPPRPPGP
ncbi:hypothetical protein BH10PLA1_BH10PLA1_08250 [soil metagenome]